MGALLNVVNGPAGPIPNKGTVPLGTKNHYVGSAVKLSGNGIECVGCGLYEVTGTVTVSQVDVSGSTPPLLSVALCQDGDDVLGAEWSANSSGTVTIPVHTVVRNACCSSSTLTMVNTGPAINLVGLDLTVEKKG